ncbi:MAG: pilus assembly protein [Bacilli bacterium]|nr:pilus assembly protein [Bacilli bacterium]
MLNSKGQVLVIFVILLPIFLMILAFVIDLGLLSIEKRNISNNTYDAVEYYLDNSNKEKTINLLKDNLDDIDIEINDTDEYVEISVLKKYKSLYTIISNNQDIKVTYKGIKETKKIIKG